MVLKKVNGHTTFDDIRCSVVLQGSNVSDEAKKPPKLKEEIMAFKSSINFISYDNRHHVK